MPAEGIDINKPVTICGQTRDGTVFKDDGMSNNPFVFLVSSSGVTFERLTIQTRLTAAIVVTGKGSPVSRIADFTADTPRLVFGDVGLYLRACGWTVRDCVFDQQGSDLTSRALVVYGICNACAVMSNKFNMGSSHDSRAIYLTSSETSRPDERNYGVLSVTLNDVANPIRSFFVQDNFQGPKEGLVLDFENNAINEIEDWAVAHAVSNRDGNVFERIIMRQNVATGNGSQGLFTIKGRKTSTLRTFRSIGKLRIHASGNSIMKTCSLKPPFKEAPGSSGCLVSYNSDVFSSQSCEIEHLAKREYIHASMAANS